MIRVKKINELDTPFDGMYQVLEEYINGVSHIPQKIKDYILDKRYFHKNPQYYLYYPYLFLSDNKYDSTFINQLSIAGFLLYKSILIKDDMLDKSRVNVDDFSAAGVMQEEALRMLMCLFGKEDKFWNLWYKRKDEYFHAYKLDKNLKTIDSYEEFENLCDKKSSMGKIGIDSLYFNRENLADEAEQLYLSHKYFYVAFQILDDINDLEEDYNNKQFNIAYFELQKICKEKGLVDMSLQNLKKYLCLTGCADDLRKLALQYLNKAEVIANELKLTLWASEIQRLYNTTLSHILNTQGYIQYIEKTQPNEDTECAKSSILGAVQYIEVKQNEDGSWNDFFNSSGVSDTWSTAFMLYFLSQDHVKGKVKSEVINKSIKFIEDRNGQWGYNRFWINDCDSSNFALLALNANNKNISPFLDELLNKQLAGGGFSTYTDGELLISSLNDTTIKNIEAWCAEHACVSAVTFLLLCSTQNSSTKVFDSLFNWLVRNCDSKGLIKSYWWTSGIYSTSFLIKGLLKKDAHWNLTYKLCDSVCAEQNDCGSFGDAILENSPFYTGLVVDALCENKTLFAKYKKQVEAAVNWLNNHQLEDGSWSSSYAMRIPHPANSQPEEVNDWPINTNITLK
jgi:squalene cyclase